MQNTSSILICLEWDVIAKVPVGINAGIPILLSKACPNRILNIAACLATDLTLILCGATIHTPVITIELN